MSEYYPPAMTMEWLSIKDARLSVWILRESRIVLPGRSLIERPPSVLEIGVYKGAWSLFVLGNSPDATVVGIDPYPNAPELAWELMGTVREEGFAERFTLYNSWKEIGVSTNFNLIHIDGEHSEQASLEDLHFAAQHLAEGGVIILDDYRHPWFPGVTSALMRFCIEKNFRAFLATENKIYLSHTDHHEIYYVRCKDRIPNELDTKLFSDWDEVNSGPLTYRQPATILEKPLLLAVGDPQGHKYRDQLRGFVPPVMWAWGTRIKHRRRRIGLSHSP